MLFALKTWPSKNEILRSIKNTTIELFKRLEGEIVDVFRIARDLGLVTGFQADLRREQINVYIENMLTIGTWLIDKTLKHFLNTKRIFSKCRGVSLRSPNRAGASPAPTPKIWEDTTKRTKKT